MESYKAKKALTQGLIHLFLIVFTITMLVPFLWMTPLSYCRPHGILITS